MMGPQGENDEMMSEINVTPLVDVMLVLLIVFMVTAPLLLPQNLDIQLPKTAASRSKSQEEATRLAVLSNGGLEMDGKMVSDAELKNLLETRGKSPEFRVRLEADKTVTYGRIAEIMGIAQSVGVSKMSFATVVEASGTPQ